MTAHTLAPILHYVLAERGWSCPGPLEKLASCFPAIPTAGLETTLIEGERIDLQQRIRGSEETRLLASWLAGKETLSEPWRRLRDALGVIAENVEEFWLELDAVADDPPLSVFVRLPQQPADEAESNLFNIVQAFGVSLSRSRLSDLPPKK